MDGEVGILMGQDLVSAAEEAPVMRALHVRVEIGLRLPVLVEDPHSRIGVRSVQVVVNAAGLSERRGDQGHHASSELVLLTRLGPGDRDGGYHCRLRGWRRGTSLRECPTIEEAGRACQTGRAKASRLRREARADPHS